MHAKRWLTALIAIPLLLLLIFKSRPLLFSCVIAILAMVALWEYFRIAYHGNAVPVPPMYAGTAYIIGFLIFAAVHFGQFLPVLMLLAFDLLIVGTLSVVRYKESQDAPLVAAKQVLGLVYIPVLLSFLLVLRNGHQGPMWLFFMLWVVAWGDTAALYSGSFFGRHKLCPAVSPKKTIEGACGGIVANLVFGWLAIWLFVPEMPWLKGTLFALIIGAVGQVGDLFESLFKRAAAVKDSGNLLPGHGGVLDRIDALLFATPTAYLLKEYVMA